MSQDIEGKITYKKFQKLPKKLCISKRIPIEHPDPSKKQNKTYEVYSSIWIMDFPTSVGPPGISLTISHGKGIKRQYLRLVFKNYDEMTLFLVELAEFITQNSEIIEEKHEEALQEWKNTWDAITNAKNNPPKTKKEPINDNNNNIININKGAQNE